uniref:Uncharacterized protein n=2 Tax=Anguilla anguilla TaxID=7936 RepID=A0A0E9QKP0_ANGAN
MFSGCLLFCKMYINVKSGGFSQSRIPDKLNFNLCRLEFFTLY